MTARPQLHASQLSTLFRCGIQYERRYVNNEIVPPGIAMVLGTSVHAAVAQNLTFKMQSGSGALMSNEQVESIARDHLTATVENSEVMFDDGEVLRGTEAVIGEAVDMAAGFARLHNEALAPGIWPRSERHIEKAFVLTLRGYDFDLAGTIDVEEEDRIRDLKTAAKTPTQDDVDASMQLTLYALHKATVDKGPLPVAVAIDALVKNVKPKAVTVNSQRGPVDFRRLSSRVDRAAEIIDKARFTPASPDWWGCSARFCGYAKTCPFWSGRP